MIKKNDYGYVFDNFNSIVDSHLKFKDSYIQSYFYDFEDPTEEDKASYPGSTITIGILRVPGYTMGHVVLDTDSKMVLDINIYPKEKCISYLDISEKELEDILKEKFINEVIN